MKGCPGPLYSLHGAEVGAPAGVLGSGSLPKGSAKYLPHTGLCCAGTANASGQRSAGAGQRQPNGGAGRQRYGRGKFKQEATRGNGALLRSDYFFYGGVGGVAGAIGQHGCYGKRSVQGVGGQVGGRRFGQSQQPQARQGPGGSYAEQGQWRRHERGHHKKRTGMPPTTQGKAGTKHALRARGYTSTLREAGAVVISNSSPWGTMVIWPYSCSSIL